MVNLSTINFPTVYNGKPKGRYPKQFKQVFEPYGDTVKEERYYNTADKLFDKSMLKPKCHPSIKNDKSGRRENIRQDTYNDLIGLRQNKETPNQIIENLLSFHMYYNENYIEIYNLNFGFGLIEDEIFKMIKPKCRSVGRKSIAISTSVQSELNRYKQPELNGMDQVIQYLILFKKYPPKPDIW